MQDYDASVRFDGPSRMTRRSGTPVLRRPGEPEESDEDELEDPAPQRRHRPILLSLKQWSLRDPRAERQVKAAEHWKDAMVKRYGWPKGMET